MYCLSTYIIICLVSMRRTTTMWPDTLYSPSQVPLQIGMYSCLFLSFLTCLLFHPYGQFIHMLLIDQQVYPNLTKSRFLDIFFFILASARNKKIMYSVHHWYLWYTHYDTIGKCKYDISPLKKNMRILVIMVLDFIAYITLGNKVRALVVGPLNKYFFAASLTLALLLDGRSKLHEQTNISAIFNSVLLQMVYPTEE